MSFGARRRLDFVVVEDGKVKGVYEVTSPTADKTAQLEKNWILEEKQKVEHMLKLQEGKVLYMIFMILKLKD